MYNIPDHPIIQNMERTGYPDGEEPRYPRCPVCGAECERIYMNSEILGCDECVTERDAWEIEDCL